ncbi:MAG: cytochrome c [Armatimonadetes bacterium]|nr:cytochrome c [Armatimonadota bacterium]MDE2205608.1 cytochrome c [Armatimonadota bacterium]
MSLRSYRAGAAVAVLGAAAVLLVTAAFAVPPKHLKPHKGVKKAAGAPAAMVALGKKVYAKSGCANCHAIGNAGGRGGPNLTDVGQESSHTVKWFEVQVTNPKAHNPDGRMPAFKGRVQGKELTALATYLTTLKPAAAKHKPGKKAVKHHHK